MIDLERKVGPLRLRAWGLVLNMAANATALYGLSQVLSGQGGTGFLLVGVAVTVACIAVCAIPAREGG